jgi:hypothetical protein
LKVLLHGCCHDQGCGSACYFPFEHFTQLTGLGHWQDVRAEASEQGAE